VREGGSEGGSEGARGAGAGLSYWASGGLWAGGHACPLCQVRTGHIGHIFCIFFKIP
jgi:hypothetical protein